MGDSLLLSNKNKASKFYLEGVEVLEGVEGLGGPENATRAEKSLACLVAERRCRPHLKRAMILNQKAASRLHLRQRSRVVTNAHTPRLTNQDSRVPLPVTA
jgi:hypothetical protein